ncbi:MAG: SAM-dependent methyltransferase, partial [bacterium]|nr:SAM-dependent methyltransferase [bacterium]
MNSKLNLVLQTLPSRVVSDEFMFLEAKSWEKGQEKKIKIVPVWDSDQLEVIYPSGEKEIVAGNSLLTILQSFLANSEKAHLHCSERTVDVKVDFHDGKVRTNIQGKNRVGEVPSEFCFPHPSEATTRQLFIKASEAKHLLAVIGISSENGEIKGDKKRKLYQIDRFIELVDGMLKEWPEKAELVVVDCGCGKSYLSFALNYYLCEKLGKKCYFIGVDSNPKVIESSRSMQQKLGYRNMEFVNAQVSDYVPSKRIDMVLSLHACDTATDQALAFGLRLNSKYIVAVPCCQSALTDEIRFHELEAIAKHAIFKNKLADLLTDGLRVVALEAHGY